MPETSPSQSGLVRPDWLDRVPSPAFDALSSTQRQALRAANPDSYLNVTRSPEDEPAGRWANTNELLLACRATLDNLLVNDAFDLDDPPGFYGYELATPEHRQLGLVADLAVRDLASGSIRPHEETKAERARLLSDHLTVVEAQSSPIAVAYRDAEGAMVALREACSRTPDLVINTGDQLEQRVWKLSPADVAPVLQAIGEQPLYLVDGHHRAAAAIERRSVSDDELADHILAAIFAAEELQLLEYNRWVTDLGARPLTEILADLSARVGLVAVNDPADAKPTRKGELGIYVAGQWYRGWLVTVEESAEHEASIVSRMDPVVLQADVLAPTFDIVDAEHDERLQYLPGGRPIDAIAAHVDQKGGIAFLLTPLDFDAVCDAADLDDVLPPKSTYFEPKVRSGVFLRTFGSRR